MEEVEFVHSGRLVVEGRFDAGSMTSDFGVMLLCQTEREHKPGVLEFGIGPGKCPPSSRLPRKKHVLDGEVTRETDGFSVHIAKAMRSWCPSGSGATGARPSRC
jgi:hypothetical protein